MRRIHRTYADTEIAALYVKIKCPHCGNEWLEADVDECGETYTLHCDDEFDDGCGEYFQMYFDAD